MEEKKFKNGTEYHLQKLFNYYSSPINLQKDERVSGTFGWIALLSIIAAYDIYAIKTQKVETLTRSFWRLTDKPLKSIIPLTAWAALSVHLLAEKSIRRKKFGS